MSTRDVIAISCLARSNAGTVALFSGWYRSVTSRPIRAQEIATPQLEFCLPRSKLSRAVISALPFLAGTSTRNMAFAAILNRRSRYRFATTLLASLLLSVFAEPAMSCTDRVAEYVGKLEALFAQNLNSITPFLSLNKAYFPLKSCDVDEISRVVSRSRYAETIVSLRSQTLGSCSF
jgi:hypothetical protein